MIAGAGSALSRGRFLRLLFSKDPGGPGIRAIFPLIARWAFIFLPRLLSMLRDSSIRVAVIGVCGMLVAREMTSPGYFAAALHHDLTRLAVGGIFVEYHPPWDYYFSFIVHLLYSEWLLVLPLLTRLIVLRSGKPERRVRMLCLAAEGCIVRTIMGVADAAPIGAPVIGRQFSLEAR